MTASRATYPGTDPASPTSSRSGRVRVLLVDDHPIVREGLAMTLQQEPDLFVCGQTASARETLEAVAKLKPQVVLLDLVLAESHGIELIKDLRLQHRAVRVLVFSMHDERLYAERAVRAGAHGYIMKKEPPRKLVEAIRKVVQGGLYFSEAVTAHLLEVRIARQKTHETPAIERLTDREIEVLELMGSGLKTQRIAQDLGVSMYTVQAHRKNIKAKLGLADFSSLACFAAHWSGSEFRASEAFDSQEDRSLEPGLASNGGP